MTAWQYAQLAIDASGFTPNDNEITYIWCASDGSHERWSVLNDTDALNRAGKEGWELVTSDRVAGRMNGWTDITTYTFKREVPAMDAQREARLA